MSGLKPTIKWAGVLCIRQRKLLVLKEIDKPFYLVPGGKVESGESDKEAARREVKEELGVEAKNLTAHTTIYENSKSTGEAIRFLVFRGELEDEPNVAELPGKTETISWVNSSYQDDGIEVGNLLLKLIPMLVEQDLID